MLLLLVQKLDLKLLIRLPFGIVVDLDLNDALSLSSVHRHKFVLLLVVRASFGSSVLGSEPEGKVLITALFDSYRYELVTLCDFVAKVLKANSRAFGRVEATSSSWQRYRMHCTYH